MITNRRTFIRTGFAASAALVLPRLASAEERRAETDATQPKPGPAPSIAPSRAVPAEVVGKEKQDPALVYAFVGAGHGNLPRVKELLAQDPSLVLAERELFHGDLETALGGASHMGNREIALYLLSHGARIDAFCAAMLGYRNTVLALLQDVPSVATTKGPHGYTLLYHAAISGDTELAAGIKRLLPEGAKDCNQALTAAGRAGHLPMTQWLLANGVTDPNARDGVGKTAYQYAIEKNFTEVAEELRRHGGAGNRG